MHFWRYSIGCLLVQMLFFLVTKNTTVWCNQQLSQNVKIHKYWSKRTWHFWNKIQNYYTQLIMSPWHYLVVIRYGRWAPRFKTPSTGIYYSKDMCCVQRGDKKASKYKSAMLIIYACGFIWPPWRMGDGWPPHFITPSTGYHIAVMRPQPTLPFYISK